MSSTDLLDDLIRSVLNDPLPEETAPPWEDVLRRLPAEPAQVVPRRRRRVRRVLVAALVVAAVFVPPAVAFHDRLTDWILGKPAPEAVTDAFQRWSTSRQRAFCCAFLQAGAGIDVAKAQGVVELATPQGIVSLWDAPQARGGKCWLVTFEPTVGTPIRIGGSCDSGVRGNGGVDRVERLQTGAIPGLVIVHARVRGSGGAELRFADGDTLEMEVVAGHAVAAVGAGARLASVVATSPDGDVVGNPVPFLDPTAACPGCSTLDSTVVIQSGGSATSP